MSSSEVVSACENVTSVETTMIVLAAVGAHDGALVGALDGSIVGTLVGALVGLVMVQVFEHSLVVWAVLVLAVVVARRVALLTLRVCP